jgi:hypothetical protein
MALSTSTGRFQLVPKAVVRRNLSEPRAGGMEVLNQVESVTAKGVSQSELGIRRVI